MKKRYRPAVNVYVRQGHGKKARHLVDMLRGLAVSYDGFGAISGIENILFVPWQRVPFRFKSVRKAHAFKRAADATLSKYITVKRVRAQLAR